MNLALIDYLIIFAYLAGILWFGFMLQRAASSSIDAYFLGDRNIPWWALGASGMASNTDISGTMVIAALIYALGVKAFFIEMRGGMVLVMAFFMVFMGKWTRRAQVMTLAEWMKLRFGNGREGQWARLVSAAANLVISIWIISYFTVGGGKFLGSLLGLDPRLAAIIMIGLALIYTSLSGFYGVVWTDVVQGIMVLFAIIFITYLAMSTTTLPEAWTASLPLDDKNFQLVETRRDVWTQWFPSWEISTPGVYSIYDLFGVSILFYFFKTSIEGLGGAGGYMSQRYFAARSDREAGLLSLFWIVLLSFRWPMVTGIALLAIHYGVTQQVIADPELVLPTVIAHYTPTGLKGVLVACFIAAGMSTFDSIINSSAAFWVRDIYQTTINPQASDRQLIRQSRLASVAIVVIGVLFSFPVASINDIWGWITMAFGAGLFVPLVLRWYWWRFNGYGFIVGTASGMAGAIFLRLGNWQLAEYQSFLVPAGISLLGCMLGTFLSPPTDPEVLKQFYEKTRPFGFWSPMRRCLPPPLIESITRENRRDLLALCVAVPWQICLAMIGVALVIKAWFQLGVMIGIFACLSLALYFTWFRYLGHCTDIEEVATSEPVLRSATVHSSTS